MHDFTLGPPVDVGEYEGPLLHGVPLHKGSCEDGVYGCRKCGNAATKLSDEELDLIGWPRTTSCDWCHKDVRTQDIRGARPISEGGHCYYEVCKDCYTRNREQEDMEWKQETCHLRYSCKQRDCYGCEETGDLQPRYLRR